MEQEIQEENDEITAEQIAIEEELNPEDDRFDEDEQDVDFGLDDIRLVNKEQE